MALTVASVTGAKDFVLGNKKAKTRVITFDASYATGGESLTAKDFGFRSLDAVIVHGAARKADGTSALIANYDYTASTMMAYWSAGAGAAPTQVTAATDLSTYSVRVTAIGSGTG